jgi:lysophospholipase L1-like esterase
MNLIRRCALAALVAVLAALTVTSGAPPAQAHQVAVAVAPESALPAGAEVYLVGDSITSMQGSWAHRWRERMCGTVTDCLEHIHVGVAGGNGGCLVEACNGHPPLAQEWDTAVLGATPKPTTVIVEIGTNDFFDPGITTQRFAEGYQHIMSSAQQAGIRVLLATIPPTTTSWTWHDIHNPMRKEVNSWMVSYFGDSNIFGLDAGLKVAGTDVADRYYYDLPGHPSDGLHPSMWGMTCIASWLGADRIR